MKLYRLPYSPYARKVQILLDWMRVTYEKIDVNYGDRNDLAELTGGYIYVPVLVDDAGQVIVESRSICEKVLALPGGERFVPSPFEGPIWAYADFVDGPLEDILFRISSPRMRDRWKTPFERALYVLVKERKFGVGCVDAWERDTDSLVLRGQALLAPTLSTLGKRPFLFGNAPTLADAALYGNCAMLGASGGEGLLERISPALVAFQKRCESFAA